MHAAAPTISAVIPMFNAAATIDACLGSVRAQRGSFELEIIVVDDGSTDGAPVRLRSSPDLHLIELPSNGGPAAARNAGIAAASGEWIAFLDADDLWPEGKLQVQIELLQRHAPAAMVFGDCLQFDANGRWPRSEFVAAGIGSESNGNGAVLPDAYLRLVHGNVITTGSVIVRRDVLAQLGGFAEELRLVEDLELWLRIARQHVVLRCPQLCLLRRRHASNLSRSREAMSLAWLEVLRRQPRGRDADPAAANAIGQQMANEQLLLAALALSRRELGQAASRLRQGLAACRSLPGLWRAARAAGQTWRDLSQPARSRAKQ